jgi:hypothetical protein
MCLEVMAFEPKVSRGWAMSEQSRLEELLSLWERQRVQGNDMSAAELCRDQPELLAELERRIAQLRQLGKLVQGVNSPVSLAALSPQPDFASALMEMLDTHAGTASVEKRWVDGVLGRKKGLGF